MDTWLFLSEEGAAQPEGALTYTCPRAIDALLYAQGAMVARVRLTGMLIHVNDCVTSETYEVVALADASRTLHEFALYCAEQALERAVQCGAEPDSRCSRALELKRNWLDGHASRSDLMLAWAEVEAAAWEGVKKREEASRALLCGDKRSTAEAYALTSATIAALACAAAISDDPVRAATEAAAYAGGQGAAWEDQNAELDQRLMQTLEACNRLSCLTLPVVQPSFCLSEFSSTRTSTEPNSVSVR